MSFLRFRIKVLPSKINNPTKYQTIFHHQAGYGAGTIIFKCLEMSDEEQYSEYSQEAFAAFVSSHSNKLTFTVENPFVYFSPGSLN